MGTEYEKDTQIWLHNFPLACHVSITDHWHGPSCLPAEQSKSEYGENWYWGPWGVPSKFGFPEILFPSLGWPELWVHRSGTDCQNNATKPRHRQKV